MVTAVFTQGMGMLVNKAILGFGMRSWRYSMLVDNGEVIKIFEEHGKNNQVRTTIHLRCQMLTR